jgi:hypothetical protein
VHDSIHQEGDHAGAGRGRCGEWRAAHERTQLVRWAQEAERIGDRAVDPAKFLNVGRLLVGVFDAPRVAEPGK